LLASAFLKDAGPNVNSLEMLKIARSGMTGHKTATSLAML
jgi:hypothetical protein